MSEEQKPHPKSVTRREVLRSVGKYSAAAGGASVVALSATEALAQATASNCRATYPWWWCWLLGYQEAPKAKADGWDGYSPNQSYEDAFPSTRSKSSGTW
ncbi:hypothetical protein SAMN06265173_1664 [Thalassovita litoralis]|jgi:hypothetical protein|uniref:Uncharacterized protein n=1 Tax=Thalassovita litoralis TaxID=1010611 RepID=A0A521FUW1_9RHOB|nr:hypothetical protein [Thalassovita litoralis]SMO99995.1 hypothetical protein SAMN06265173_1664 [Thalassovita litoralis]